MIDLSNNSINKIDNGALWGFNDGVIIYFKYINIDCATNPDDELVSSIDHHKDNICYFSEYYYFKICKTSTMQLKLVEHLIDNWQPETLEITDDKISSIEKNAFQQLSIKTLIFNCFSKTFTLYPASFAGLKKLEFLILNTSPIQVESYIFGYLVSLKFLGISVNESSNITFSQLFQNLIFFDNLLLTRQNRVDICHETLCTNTNFNITSLHYKYGKFTNLQQLAFSCLKQLEYLAVTNSSLKTIEPTAFDGLNNIKYLSLSSNQIQTIDSNVFTNLNLSSLDLSYNLLTHIKKDTFYGMKTKALDISYNKIIQIDDDAFKDMNLHHIYYNNNPGAINDTFYYFDDIKIEANCLPSLENLVLDVGPISLQENLFDQLISLNYLRIEIKYNPQSPSKYINNVLKTVPSLRVLEILNSDSINICNNPISNENSLPLTGLYYTGGSIGVLPTNSLICLWNLEKLSISKTQLTTIEAGVFDSLNNLKYIHLAFNKLTRITTGAFNRLNNLITLDLNHNKIIEMDDKSLRKSVENNLHLLNLSYNEFSFIKKDTFAGFKCSQLDLSHNKISHIEDDAFKDTKIHDIFLFNNFIMYVKMKAWKIPLYTFVHVKKPSYFISFCSGIRTRVCDHFGSYTFIGVRTNVLDISNNKIVEIDNGAFKDMNLNHLYYYNNNDRVFVNSRYWYIDDSQIEVNCTNQNTYRICKKGETLSSVDIPNKYSFFGRLITSDTLEIFDERISAMDVGPIEVKENLFDRLISLNYLRIEIKYNPQSPSKYINNVLKTVPSLRVLEILNSDSINICNNPISNENSLPLTGLYYTRKRTRTCDDLGWCEFRCIDYKSSPPGLG
ncbi:toll-like receptor 13 [Aphidius gifuensis]|uniref:toll-like receptor 13 n=1 Tax=Aphidius gifuensis TaxID=684658 RepID=UPI001CDC6EA5|nr:toll-like receptor 13 [Aphidius gifuensis]